MDSLFKRESLILLIGDCFFFVASLWLALFLRNLEAPSEELFLTHLTPFTLLFIVWIVVFYIAGLYEKHTVILKSNLPSILGNTQLINSAIAVAFFYLIEFFNITPKTILFIYLLISFALILYWRTYGYFLISHGGYKNNAVLIGSGEEVKELLSEVNNNEIYNIKFVFSVDLNRVNEQGFWDEIVSRVYSDNVSIIAIDLGNKNAEPVLPHLYNLLFSKINFIDMHKIYEDIFDRVPLSLLKYNWFLENISSNAPHIAYDSLKRLLDIFISLVAGVVTLLFYPFIMLAIKLDDGGPIFFTQERVGANNKIINILKFRSMTVDDGSYVEGQAKNEITRVGSFLRKTRVDELPQLWNVLKGDISLIGPRPELPALVKQYEKDIPYYNVRHLIKPGLSGWAQIYHDQHAHHKVDTIETKNKLSYDLYYIKNRSFLLDLKIVLQTLKTIVSIAGR